MLITDKLTVNQGYICSARKICHKLDRMNQDQGRKVRRRRDAKTDIERIVEAAWKVVDAEGIDGLTTRRLAKELNVQSPALYHHVASMQILYGLMIEAALRKAPPASAEGVEWRQWLRDMAVIHRDTLLSHRDSGRIASLSSPSVAMGSQLIPAYVDALARAGFARADAIAAIGMIGSLILGLVINEQAEPHRELATSFMPMEAVFEFAIGTMIQGLADRLSSVS